MEKKLKIWSVAGVVITFLIAGGWHFLYKALPWGVIGMIAPVNESPWEHAKLFFVPALIGYYIKYCIIGRRFPNYMFAHSVSLLVMPALMLLLHSIYQTFLEETLPLDITNAFVTIAAGAWLAYRLTVSNKDFSGRGYRAAALLIVLALLVMFAALTHWPPHWPIFKDPSANLYGIPPA